MSEWVECDCIEWRWQSEREEPFRLVRARVDRTFLEARISWIWLAGE